MSGTATRFWNNAQYNPTDQSYQTQNPLIPDFFQGPNYQELQKEPLPDEKKMVYFLKKEIEKYRLDQKKSTYNSKTDMMIKLLLEELDKQHKRIHFLESKIKEQKARILRMEDAMQQKSHRLLLRCGSAYRPTDSSKRFLKVETSSRPLSAASQGSKSARSNKQKD